MHYLLNSFISLRKSSHPSLQSFRAGPAPPLLSSSSIFLPISATLPPFELRQAKLSPPPHPHPPPPPPGFCPCRSWYQDLLTALQGPLPTATRPQLKFTPPHLPSLKIHVLLSAYLALPQIILFICFIVHSPYCAHKPP